MGLNLDNELYLIEEGLLKEYRGSEELVTVPEGVIVIGEGVFSGNETIKNIKLPESLKGIGECNERDIVS